ncbi:MAG: Holliday junction resolvase RuvX [Candidatus Zixiibacteriota bacterium]
MTNSSDKTILAIDYGSRRIGVAKSDALAIIASPFTTLEVKSKRDAWDKIVAIIAEIQPATIVIGYPVLASGDKSPKCLEVDKFIEQLSTVFKGPIHRVDEAYTSVEAASVIHAHGKRVGKDKKRVDRIAAVIILQRFLEEHHG